MGVPGIGDSGSHVAARVDVSQHAASYGGGVDVHMHCGCIRKLKKKKCKPLQKLDASTAWKM